jgi:hypothetical protein
MWTPSDEPVARVLQEIKLDGSKLARFEEYPRSGSTTAVVAKQDSKVDPFIYVDVEAIAVKVPGADGQVLGRALLWTCQANVMTRLYVNGQHLSARLINFEARNISWKAGDGWPVYTRFAPSNDYSREAAYVHARIHQIVPSILSIPSGEYYTSNQNPGTFQATLGSGALFVSVNDTYYRDNTGTWEFLLYSYA